MKLLRVKASHFKNCHDDTVIDLVARSKKTAEDKEYELQEIAEDLYVYSTAAFVGKNASGKTTAIELLDCCYSILGEFRLNNKHYGYDGTQLEIIFFHEDHIYKYTTTLLSDSTLGNMANFSNQHIYKKKYFKTKLKDIYADEGFEELTNLGEMLEDTASVYFILKKKQSAAVYFDSNGEGADTYQMVFKVLKTYKISNEVLANIITIFDDNILDLQMVDERNYKVVYRDCEKVYTDRELVYMLSSGTTKGILLYTMVVASLRNGFDLLIDEVENHFHKTLVENIISLYKDKTVNRLGASLMFTTHYCEVLDLFNRQDNIWICQADGKIRVRNMYEDYDLRSGLLKSKQFYNNAFHTAVNYEELMNLKRKLMK